MFKLKRGSWPCCLEVHQQDWTARYIVARSQNPAARFRWFSDECYYAVRKALLEMTQHHCAFCDGFIGCESRETLEIYGLNLPMRKKERLRQLRVWHVMGKSAELNEFAYRYFLND